jgi:heme/copper-type cytochrome/quinol oxidase subunit 2
MSTATAAAAAQ